MPGLNYLVELNDIDVLHLAQYPDLALHTPLVAQLSDLLPMNDFNCNFLLRALVNAKFDLAEGAFTQVTHHAIFAYLLQVPVRARWLFFDAFLGATLVQLLVR